MESAWLGTYSQNHYIMFNLQCNEESETFIYSSANSLDNLGNPSLPLNCASALKIYAKHPE